MLRTDSRLVKQGDTFIAIKNVNTDGHDYIESAIKNGATKIICEHGNYNVETLVVPNTRKYLEDYLYNNYYNKFSDMKLIGVTGTNGKTTICYLVYQLLNKLGTKCAYIGTIGFYYEGHKEELNNTTPDVDLLYKMFLEAKENGCEALVMEVSSHALDMNRIHGLLFDEVAFTNLTQDHLDYHKTMENYLNAKLKIFNYLKDDGVMIVNNDDSYASNFINEKSVTLGYKEGSDLRIKNASYTPMNTTIDFTKDGKDYTVVTNLTSKFNVYNYLTCYYILNKLGIDDEKIIETTKDIYPPKGRCEIIKVNKGVAVIDYAHTPDAVEKVINSFNELKQNRVVTVIGCGGDRDRTKRPIMGDTACRLSDHVIFTNDNPRTEDPNQIMNDIVKDLKYNNFEIVFDRVEAIHKAIDDMEDNDIILILGKGHEDYQIIGHEKRHYDDHETVQKWIEEHK